MLLDTQIAIAAEPRGAAQSSVWVPEAVDELPAQPRVPVTQPRPLPWAFVSRSRLALCWTSRLQRGRVAGVRTASDQDQDDDQEQDPGREHRGEASGQQERENGVAVLEHQVARGVCSAEMGSISSSNAPRCERLLFPTAEPFTEPTLSRTCGWGFSGSARWRRDGGGLAHATERVFEICALKAVIRGSANSKFARCCAGCFQTLGGAGYPTVRSSGNTDAATKP